MSAIARMKYANDAGFQERVKYFFLTKALDVLTLAEPNADDLKLAQAVITNNVDVSLMCNVVITNATIGNSIDNTLSPVDAHIEYAVLSEGKFNLLANVLAAANAI